MRRPPHRRTHQFAHQHGTPKSRPRDAQVGLVLLLEGGTGRHYDIEYRPLVADPLGRRICIRFARGPRTPTSASEHAYPDPGTPASKKPLIGVGQTSRSSTPVAIRRSHGWQNSAVGCGFALPNTGVHPDRCRGTGARHRGEYRHLQRGSRRVDPPAAVYGARSHRPYLVQRRRPAPAVFFRVAA